jgi:hypothetical protein
MKILILLKDFLKKIALKARNIEVLKKLGHII